MHQCLYVIMIMIVLRASTEIGDSVMLLIIIIIVRSAVVHWFDYMFMLFRL